MRNVRSEPDIAVEEPGIVEFLFGNIDVEAAKAGKTIRNSILYRSIEIAVISLQSSVDIAVG